MSENDDLRDELNHVLIALDVAEQRLCAAKIRLRQLSSCGPVLPRGLRLPLAKLGAALGAISGARRDIKLSPLYGASEVSDDDD